MSAPQTFEELQARTLQNQRMSGYGLETKMHITCPFCGAPDYAEIRVVAVQEDASKNATCKECGRSTRTEFYRSGPSIRFEIVQTGGDDPPEWLPFRLKRAGTNPA